jgi:Fe-S-cluster containining protein
MSEFDCQACGACCKFGGDVTVEEGEAQVPRHLTRSVRRLMGYASWEADCGTRRMARKNDCCIAFRGQVGGACRCSIYDRRPEVCRTFTPGSPDCLAARLAGETGTEG